MKTIVGVLAIFIVLTGLGAAYVPTPDQQAAIDEMNATVANRDNITNEQAQAYMTSFYDVYHGAPAKFKYICNAFTSLMGLYCYDVNPMSAAEIAQMDAINKEGIYHVETPTEHRNLDINATVDAYYATLDQVLNEVN